MSCGGLIRDGIGTLAQSGGLGPVLNNAWAGYSAVYHVEVALLFATLVAIGPLARLARKDRSQAGLGLAEIPR